MEIWEEGLSVQSDRILIWSLSQYLQDVHPESVSILTKDAKVCSVADVEEWKDKIDVMILMWRKCYGSSGADTKICTDV